MTFVAGAVPIVAAMTFVLTHSDAPGSPPDHAAVRPIWAALLILSWVLVVALALSWLFAAGERPRELRWTSLAPLGGFLFAALATAGWIAESQPYSHVAADALPEYLNDHLGLVLTATSLIGLGCTALYLFLGGAWRIVSNRMSPDLTTWERPVARGVVVLTGLAWIWGTLAVTALTAWQALVVSDAGYDGDVEGIARVVDAAANATLVPAAIFVCATTGWLVIPRGVLASTWARGVVALVGAATALLLAARGLAAVDVGPWMDSRVAWVALATWVVATSTALLRPVDEATVI